MKSGAGDDPFADEPTGNGTGDPADAEPDDPPDVAADDASDDQASAASAPDVADPAPEDTRAESGDATGDRIARQDIPWVLRRGSVKDDRPNVTQFFLRDETDRAERRFQSAVEDRLDRDVYTLDLREAAYLVAMRHPDEVADQLRDWGYEYLD